MKKRVSLSIGASAAIAATVLLGASAVAFAANGQVKGKIGGQEKLVPEVYTEAARPEAHRYNWREPSPTVRPEFRVLSANPSREICIAALSASHSGAHDPILVKVTGGRTIPTTIAIPPGTRLSFKNLDPFPHKLFQVSDQKWAASQTAAGSQREWTAPGPGRYEIRDELFPSVRMFVVVEPQVVDFVYPARDGSFVMNLPPGEYTLKAYFGGRQVSKDVGLRVPDRGGTLDLKEPLVLTAGSDAK